MDLIALLLFPLSIQARDTAATIDPERTLARFESAVLWIGREDRVLDARAFGNSRIDTRFDLASLTKPFATALVIHHLVRRSEYWIQSEEAGGPACVLVHMAMGLWASKWDIADLHLPH
jgi:hypothetical protein